MNQRAVYDGVGFIHILSKNIWDRHPCCAFAASKEFVTGSPNTYAALLKAIIDATAFATKPENRKQIAEAIAPANYLNQPVTVVEQVLTGTFADGLGNVQKVPDRIDFDPFPWESFAVWILTQMKRWGQIKGDVDYAGIAKQVFLATDTTKLMKEVGLTPPTATTKTFVVMGKTFDPAKPEEYSRASRSRSGVMHDRCAFAMSLARSRARALAGARGVMTRSLSLRAAIVSIAIFVAVHHRVASRHARHRHRRADGSRIRQADGRDRDAGQVGDAGSARCRRKALWEHLKQPFYDKGPNDKGVGIQLAYSLARVLIGYLLAVLVAIPIGFLIGMSPLMSRALDPFIQVLKPISPLAWMPLALYTIKDSGLSAIFVIFICSVWPMLINTAFGVSRGAQGMAQRRAHARSRSGPPRLHGHPAGGGADHPHRHAHLDRHRLARDRRRRDARRRHRHRLLRLERME